MSAESAIVVGLGAMGSAAAFHLASRGVRVIGFDRHTPPHDRGSSHGKTRIIREAYFEDPCYVPLVQRAYELWEDLASEMEDPIFLKTGGLMIGPPEGTLVRGARRSAEQHGLAHEVLTPREVEDRFPAFDLGPSDRAVYEPRAGILFPEACIAGHLERAEAEGAELRTGTAVSDWTADEAGVRVRTEAGDEVEADRLLLAAGAWMPNLLADLDLPFTVTRQVLHWFCPITASLFAPEECPIYIWEDEPDRFFYGFPSLDGTLKVARHGEGEPTSPDDLRRTVDEEEKLAARDLLREHLPNAGGPHLESAVCMYTNLPDGHFLIDRHPDHDRVWLASPCSGHGFKFSAAIGELLARAMTGAPIQFNTQKFRLSRFE